MSTLRDILVFVFDITSAFISTDLTLLFFPSLFILKTQPSCLPLIDLPGYWLLLVRNWFMHVGCSFSAEQHRLKQVTRPQSAACQDDSSCVKSWWDRHWSWKQFGQRKQRQKPSEKQRLVNETVFLPLWCLEKLVSDDFLSFIVISAIHHMTHAKTMYNQFYLFNAFSESKSRITQDPELLQLPLTRQLPQSSLKSLSAYHIRTQKRREMSLVPNFSRHHIHQRSSLRNWKPLHHRFYPHHFQI